jgi:hypothetical protein
LFLCAIAGLLAFVCLEPLVRFAYLQIFVKNVKPGSASHIKRLGEMILVLLNPLVPLAISAVLFGVYRRFERKGIRLNDKDRISRVGNLKTLFLEERIFKTGQITTSGFILPCANKESKGVQFDSFISHP